MNKLLTITLRWMRKDKKRTLLTFLAILTATYMMIFLGIYFSSTISMLHAKEEFDNGSAHIKFNCENREQAEILSKNASVEDSAVVIDSRTNFIESYLSDWLGRSDGSYFPIMTVNGKSLYELDYDEDPTTYAMISGDVEKLRGGETIEDPHNRDRTITTHPSVTGRMPEKEGEIMISAKISKILNGISAGDKVTFKYTIYKNGITYKLRKTAPGAYDPNEGVSSDKFKWVTVDENGEPVFVEDKDNLIMQFVCQKYPEGLSGHRPEYFKVKSALSNLNYYFSTGKEDDHYVFADDGTVYDYFAKYDSDAEKVLDKEYTFEVVGVINNYAIADYTFCEGDTQAEEFLSTSSVNCYTRIYEDYDIDEEEKILRENVGLPDDWYDTDKNIDHVYSKKNDMLIFLEGRSLDTSIDPMIVIGAFAAVVAVFMLFTRLIINNAFELSSAYRTEQYAALRTVGASRRQIFAMVIIECLMYTLIALPLATVLALVTGKFVMSKIMDIKIFDVMYGAGISDTFFTLRIIPAIMVFIVLLTVAEIIISAYASASRILKEAALRTVSAGGAKVAKPRKKLWLTRRIFGFPTGYAVRSTARSSMRFFITLISTIMSGILLVTVCAMIFAVDKTNALQLNRDIPDFELTAHCSPNGVSGAYNLIKNSGFFKPEDPINSRILRVDLMQKDEYTGERLDQFIRDYFSEEYYAEFKKNHQELSVFTVDIIMVNRAYYDTLGLSMSYDEFVERKGVLLSSEVSTSGGKKTEIPGFRDTGIRELVLPTNEDKTVEDPETHAFRSEYIPKDTTLMVAGFVPVSDKYDYISTTVWGLKGLIPIENVSSSMLKTDNMYNNAMGVDLDFQAFYILNLKLDAADGKLQEASDLLKTSFSGSSDTLYNNTIEKRTNDNISRALKIAGLSIAIIVFAVALLNIISNSAANIVNRRKELSMLRACGMSLRQQFVSLTVEAAFCAAVTAASSAVLGTLLARLLFTIIDTTIDMPTLPWESAIAIGVLVLVLILGTYLPALFKMSRASIAEEVKIKE